MYNELTYHVSRKFFYSYHIDVMEQEVQYLPLRCNGVEV